MANTAPVAPVRTVVLAVGGKYVNEVFTSADGTVARVTAYTLAQLQTAKANLATQQAAQEAKLKYQQDAQAANLDAMIALLS